MEPALPRVEFANVLLKPALLSHILLFTYEYLDQGVAFLLHLNKTSYERLADLFSPTASSPPLKQHPYAATLAKLERRLLRICNNSALACIGTHYPINLFILQFELKSFVHSDLARSTELLRNIAVENSLSKSLFRTKVNVHDYEVLQCFEQCRFTQA